MPSSDIENYHSDVNFKERLCNYVIGIQFNFKVLICFGFQNIRMTEETTKWVSI